MNLSEPPIRKLPKPVLAGHPAKGSLTCFGVGDGRSCPDRNHAAFLYRFGSTSILVDCGEPVDRSLIASGSGPETPDGIVLSHLHADHVGGLFMLLQGLWLQGRRRALPVFCRATRSDHCGKCSRPCSCSTNCLNSGFNSPA